MLSLAWDEGDLRASSQFSQGSFGAPYLAAPKRGDRRHVRWAMVSIRRRFTPEKLKRPIRLQFVVGGAHLYALRGDRDGLHVQEGELEAPHARVELDEPAFMSLMFRGEPMRALQAKNELSVTGDESAFRAFLAAVSDVRVE